MKLNFGQKFIILLLILVVIIVGKSLLTKGANFASPKSTPKDVQLEDQSEKNLKKIKVTANAGQFKPNEFEVPLNDSIILEVTASDQDYLFQSSDFGINKNLPKGKTTRVKIEGLGVGKYQFSCGANCSGSVEVVSKSDEEED